MFEEHLHLIGEHDFVVVRGAEQGHNVHAIGEVLDEGAQWGHPHARAHEGDTVRRTSVLCERPIRAFDGHEGPGTDARQLRAVVSEGLDGDPEARRARHGRQRIGVRLPPEPSP